jgi:hypothetical protein
MVSPDTHLVAINHPASHAPSCEMGSRTQATSHGSGYETPFRETVESFPGARPRPELREA